MTSKTKSPNNKIINLSRRNPLHKHPLLRKGGTHKKTNKALRRKEKIVIKKEWLPQCIFLVVYFGESFLTYDLKCKII